MGEITHEGKYLSLRDLILGVRNIITLIEPSNEDLVDTFFDFNEYHVKKKDLISMKP